MLPSTFGGITQGSLWHTFMLTEKYMGEFSIDEFKFVCQGRKKNSFERRKKGIGECIPVRGISRGGQDFRGAGICGQAVFFAEDMADKQKCLTGKDILGI